MKQRNPRFGCRRIAMQMSNMFGININKDVVWRILSKYYKPSSNDDGPSWLAFLGNTKDSLWSLDLFRCESILLKSHEVMVIMDQYTRRIIGLAKYAGELNGIAVCRMFNTIITKKALPKYLSSDNDPLFTFQRWKSNLPILDIKEVKSIPYTPRSHPFVERLIRICRNELLDHSIFWTQLDLQRKLDTFQYYINEYRSHMGIRGNTPGEISENKKSKLIHINQFRWESYCRGLFQLPSAA